MDTSSPFEDIPNVSAILTGNIDEASGIANSKNNPGYLWVQEDSGNPTELTLLSIDGTVGKKFFLKGITNRDWEDMAIANGPQSGKNYLYLAETGDNNQVFNEYAIYRFIEPVPTDDTVFSIDALRFKYPDKPHDAEAILIDNASNDIYILTKRDSLSLIYRLPYPQSITSTTTAIYEGTMTTSGLTSAAISPNGNDLLAKNYTDLFYWKRNSGESISTVLKKQPLKAGYKPEPQGEAICFKNDNAGFFTLSEKPFFASSVSLNFYKRK